MRHSIRLSSMHLASNLVRTHISSSCTCTRSKFIYTVGFFWVLVCCTRTFISFHA